MKKSLYNAMLAVLTILTFLYIAAVSYVTTPETKPNQATQIETLNVWKQSVTAEYTKNNINYKGGEIK